MTKVVIDAHSEARSINHFARYPFEKKSPVMPSESSHERVRRKARKKRRTRGGHRNKVGYRESVIVGLLVLCFLGAVGLCGWVLVPPLLRYLSESNLW